MNGYDKYLEYQYNQSGGFFTKLIRAIEHADEINLSALELGFPELVWAYKIWSRVGVSEFAKYVSPDHQLLPTLAKGYNLDLENLKSEANKDE